MSSRKNKHQVHQATTARTSRLDEQAARMVKYLVLMLIRMVCFGLVFVTPDPWRWGFAVGAIVLPYLAVLLVNAVGEKRPDDLPDVPAATPMAPTPIDSGPGSGEVIVGEVIDATDHGLTAKPSGS